MDTPGRTKRSLSKQATKKLDALKKFQALKGGKHKIEVEEEEQLYDEVDEVEYAKIVTERQHDDWIVEDGTNGGYADNGREIFDDEFDDDDDDIERSAGGSSIRKHKYSIKKREEITEKKGDIRSMFSMKRSTVSISKTSRSVVTHNSSTSHNNSMADVQIDENEIDNLMDSITSKGSPAFTPQPLKLQRKTPSSSLNRSAFGSAKRKIPGEGSPRAASSYGPPSKKRLSIKQEFTFDDITDGSMNESANKSVNENRNPMRKVQPSDISIKEEYDDMMDDDFMLPDNTAMDDFVENVPNVKSEIENEDMKKLKEEESSKFKEEAWVNNNSTVKSSNEPISSSATILPKEIPFQIDEDKNKLIKFFWFDAYADQNRNSEVLYLFGKVYIEELKKFVSATLLVKNIERRVFILPRENFLDDKTKKVTLQDVYDEFTERVAKKLKIAEFKSRKVIKKYAFDLPGVPAEGKYLEVLYNASHPQIPDNLHTGNTYKYVFGSNTNTLENFILDLKLKGPQWLVVKNPDISEPPVTWSRIELSVPNKTHISIDEENTVQPELTVLSLNFKTFVNQATKINEIIAISCLIKKDFRFDMGNPNHTSQNPMKTVNGQKTKEAEANGSLNQKYDSHFCMITKPSAKTGIELPIDFDPKMALKNYDKTTIQKMNSEREMLNFFLAKLGQIDPDVIVGHDIYAFDYDLLLSRFTHYKISNLWSKLGRLKRSGLVTRSKDKFNLAGRIVCDVKTMAKELIRLKSYDLTELSSQILKKGRFEVDQALLPNYYSSSKQLIRLVELLMKDNDLTLSIMYELNCLPLAKQITNISGNLLSKTLLGGRSERNEFLLLHAFNEKGYLVPDKENRFSSRNNLKKPQQPSPDDDMLDDMLEDIDDEEASGNPGKKGAGKKKAAAAKKNPSYAGGLVLDPKVGFYDKLILLMDFNSLYPSIIQEFNICFTTIQAKKGTDDNPQELATLLNDRDSWEEGILPREIRKLVESRREVKKALYNPDLTAEERIQLDIKQKALKISANSMYGCLGFQFSRFYAKHLAALVTFKGREILLNTKEMVEKIGYDVIYGDTDSIMIQTNCATYEEVKKTGIEIQKEVNRLYKLLEIEIDGVFRCMLLLKKKKYAALTVSLDSTGQPLYQREIKGLDIVRRDWSMLSKIAGETVIEKILVPDKPVELIVDGIHAYLRQLADSVKKEGELPLENFVINKALTRKPEEYNDAKLTHVAVAMRWNQTNLDKPLRAGDTVPFIICQDGTKNSATQRGYHIEEVRSNSEGKLTVDTYYYLSQQLLPVVSRLCEPLDGTETAIIAELLGVESAVKRSVHQIKVEMDPALTFGDHKFDICRSLTLKCPKCDQEILIRDLFRIWNKKTSDIGKLDAKQLLENRELFQLTLASCENCRITFDQRHHFFFEMLLRKQLDSIVNQFYQKEMYCDDTACSHRTRYVCGNFNNQKDLQCSACRHGTLQYEVSEHFLYQQLSFFSHIFDLEKAFNRLVGLELTDNHKAQRKAIKDDHGTFFEKMRLIVQTYMDRSSYNEFDLGYLFRKFRYKV